MGNASALAGLLLLFGAASASPASAQTATVDGAYARLSPGNAKVARALFEAQMTNTTPAVTTASTTAATASKALSMDQIAAMKGGQGWGQVFQSMKALGLVAEKSLGQVVSRYQNRVNSGGVKTVANPSAKKAAALEVSASYDGSGYGRESLTK
jgi:hypothetical protein